MPSHFEANQMDFTSSVPSQPCPREVSSPCLQTRTHVPWSNCKNGEFDLNEPTRNSGHHGISGKKTRPLGGSPHSVFGAISHLLKSIHGIFQSPGIAFFAQGSADRNLKYLWESLPPYGNICGILI